MFGANRSAPPSTRNARTGKGLLPGGSRRERRRPALVPLGFLLEEAPECQDAPLLERTPEDLHPDWQVRRREAAGNRERRDAREVAGCAKRIRARERLLEVGFERRRHERHSWRDQDVELLEDLVELALHDPPRLHRADVVGAADRFRGL